MLQAAPFYRHLLFSHSNSSRLWLLHGAQQQRGWVQAEGPHAKLMCEA